MARNATVLVQITKIDALLEVTGVRDYCIACIKGPKGGCCQGCSSLGPNGCTDKPLACALWLCSNARQEFPAVQDALYAIGSRYPYGVARAYRHLSIQYEQLMDVKESM